MMESTTMESRPPILRSRAAAVAFIAAALLLVAGAARVGAHLKVTAREWAFSSYTRDSQDSKNKVDPVTVIWAGKPTQYTPSRIELALENQFQTGGDWTPTAACGPFSVPSGNQGLWYQDASGQNGVFDDVQDINLVRVLNDCGSRQYHTRLWNDFEHIDLFPGIHTENDRYTWTVGGIHYEQWRRDPDHPPFPDGHRLLESFEKTASDLWFWLHLCFRKSRHNWRYLPGSTTRERVSYGYSNGYLTKVDLSQKLSGCG